MHAYQVWIIPGGQLQASLSKTNAAPGLPGLNGMFTVPLASGGGQSATHYASAGFMSEAETAYLNANLNSSWMVYELTHAQLEAGQRPESPLSTIARLGYTMVTA